VIEVIVLREEQEIVLPVALSSSSGF